jgi:hypothetical protein
VFLSLCKKTETWEMENAKMLLTVKIVRVTYKGEVLILKVMVI